MFGTKFAVYFGTESEEQFLGFNADNNFFAVLVIDKGLEKSKGKELLWKLSNDIKNLKISTLQEYDNFIVSQLKELDFPTGAAFAAGYINEAKCFIKTMGGGMIYLKRGKDLALLIDGGKSASGFVTDQDVFIFTVSKFQSAVGALSKFNELIDGKEPSEIKELITPTLKAQDDQLMIALFAIFQSKEVQETIESYPREETTSKPPQVAVKIKEFIDLVKDNFQVLDRNKRATLIIVVGIFAIFLVSIIWGALQRAGFLTNSKIKSSRELIQANLAQAEEVAFLNQERANALIVEAKSNLNDLKKQMGKKKSRDITELENLIKEKEEKIFKKEEKPSEEFFDLSVEDKNAKGTKLSLDKDNLVILDQGKAVYSLSISKKSLDRKSNTEIKKALLAVPNNEALIFFTNDGVYKFEEGKSKKIIEKDKDWGKIVGISIYGNNIYLLDSSRNQIYKYTPAENGYSAKSSYLKEKDLNFSDANSLAIDSSVYVGFEDRVMKFVSGFRDSFNTSFPEEDPILTKTLTNADLEKVYAWSKSKGAIYIINKTGSYERQINSSILSKASDIEIYKNDAYVLSEGKIYKVSLN